MDFLLHVTGFFSFYWWLWFVSAIFVSMKLLLTDGAQIHSRDWKQVADGSYSKPMHAWALLDTLGWVIFASLFVASVFLNVVFWILSIIS